MTDNYLMIRNEIERVTLGFSHTNMFALVYSMIIIEMFYVFRNNIQKLHYLLLFVSLFYLNYFTGSRGSLILLGMFIIFKLLINIKPIKRLFCTKVSKIIFSTLFLVFTLFSFVSINEYRNNNNFFVKLNENVSNRIASTSTFLDKYEVNAFGNDLEIIGSIEANKLKVKPHILDNSYLYVILRYGVVTFIVLTYFFGRMFWYSLNKKNIEYVIILLILLIYGLVETYTYRVPYNAFLLLMGKNI